MKALTIWQPWATLIAIGAKPYEFRGWPVPGFVRGQRIGIHAGARAVKRAEVQDLIDRLTVDAGREAWTTGLKAEIALPLLVHAIDRPGILPLSAMLCTGTIGTAVNAFDIVKEFGAPPLNDSDRDEHANFAWPITDIELLLPPQETKGAQGFWNWGGHA